MDNEMKTRGNQIPGFGNWEYVNELPITQYFESARQAGLIRYTSSEQCYDNYYPYNNNYRTNYATGIVNHDDLYSLDYVNSRNVAPKQAKRSSHMKEGSNNNKKQAGKVFDVTVTELPQAHVMGNKRHTNNSVNAVKKKQQKCQYDVELNTQACRAPKAVDEDLYKIPPELLKKKRRLGFFSRCLVAPCAV